MKIPCYRQYNRANMVTGECERKWQKKTMLTLLLNLDKNQYICKLVPRIATDHMVKAEIMLKTINIW